MSYNGLGTKEFTVCEPLLTPILSLHTNQVAHQAGAYLSFCRMKRLGLFLLPPVRMGYWSIAGTPPALNPPVLIYTPGWRQAP